MTRGRRFAWVMAYAVVTFLAFPHPLADRTLDLGVAFGWLSPALLILALRDLGPAAAARWGFLASWLAHTAVLHWIYVVTVVYGHAPPVVGLLAPALLAVYIGLFGALFGTGLGFLAQRGAASPLAIAVLWTALDHLRSFALTGFPWATLGYAQHLNPWLLPWSAWGGVYALSFWTALGGAAGAACLARPPDPAARRPPGPWLALAAVALAHAVFALAPSPESGARDSVRVAVLQGNIDQGVKWSRSWVERTFAIYERLTREAAARRSRRSARPNCDST